MSKCNDKTCCNVRLIVRVIQSLSNVRNVKGQKLMFHPLRKLLLNSNDFWCKEHTGLFDVIERVQFLLVLKKSVEPRK